MIRLIYGWIQDRQNTRSFWNGRNELRCTSFQDKAWDLCLEFSWQTIYVNLLGGGAVPKKTVF